MLRTLITAVAISALFSGSALAGDIIAGDWKTASNETASISGSGSYSIVLKTGKHAGKTIGSLSGSNGKYTGTITDPADNKQYSGSARVAGSSMKLKGCALKIFCKTQTWTKLGG